MASGASTSNRPLCSICNHKHAIYTCPRCSIRTCSLPCSTTHKSTSGCSGERDKAAYIPMNEYGWGALMNDYTYLEDMGRRVGDWGKEIVVGAFNRSTGEIRGRGGRGMSRGRGTGHGQALGRTKRELLKAQLEMRDITMDLLPNGMDKRKINQSHWDFKLKTAFLTVEFKFHPPADPSNPSAPMLAPPLTFVTHKNDVNKPLMELLRTTVTDRFNSKKDRDSLPLWLHSLVHPTPEDPDAFHIPHCVLAAHIDPSFVAMSRSRLKSGYYSLDAMKPLCELLQNTQFIEFPTIEVWEEFRGVLVDKEGAVTRQPVNELYDEQLHPRKRRKINVKAGKAAISGLLGGYGSDDPESDDPVDASKSGLEILGQYEGSDEDLEDEEEGEIEPEALLALMQQAQKRANEFGGDDLVDWGDSGDET
ncbi:hypothetical protein C8J56DRAFT_782154 [Mycena floridula]|nr:hypothetical protein C8J56DRAFT_782154 [Mycena floridula]